MALQGTVDKNLQRKKYEQSDNAQDGDDKALDFYF